MLRFLILILIVLLVPFSNATFAQVSVGNSAQISIGIGGAIPAGGSGSPILPPNGQVAVFRSSADNILSGDTNKSNDVFVSSIATGQITRLSVAASGAEGNRTSTNPAVSIVDPSGFFAVAFESDSTNLGVLPDRNLFRDVYVRIPSLNITELISSNTNKTSGNGRSFSPSIAYIQATNTIRIVFTSEASDLVVGDTNALSDIFLAEFTVPASPAYDPLTLVSIRRISLTSTGAEANGASDTPRISGDGSTIVFTSSATNLIPGIAPTTTQVYRYDIKSGALSLISAPGTGASTNPTLSFTGRYIAFLTAAGDIIAGSSSSHVNVAVYDAKTNVITQANTSVANIGGNGTATDASIASSGRFVTFSDSSTNLVSADTNNFPDIFIKDLATGSIDRISHGVSGTEADGSSDLSFPAPKTFTSLDGAVLYRSFASNITGAGTSSGAGDIYLNPITLERLPLTKQTTLEVPPDVTPGNRKATIFMESFKTFKKRDSELIRDVSLSLDQRATTQPKTKIEFQINVSKVGGKKADKKTLTAKRNRVTATKLKPGTYVAKYKVVAKQGSKTVAKTPFSPNMQFVVK